MTLGSATTGAIGGFCAYADPPQYVTCDVQVDCQIRVRWNQQSLQNPSASCENVAQDHP